jgi:hypothetical protein
MLTTLTNFQEPNGAGLGQGISLGELETGVQSLRSSGEFGAGGDRLLRLISRPWGGAIKMLVGEDELVLDAG